MSYFPPDSKSLHQYFIGLLIAEISLFIITLPIVVFGVMMAEAAIEEAGAPTELTASEAVVGGFSCLILTIGLPATIASWIGLFLYKAWGRWLYLAITVTFYVIDVPISVFDFSLTWGLPTSLQQVGSLVSGAILAMIYLTPLATRFNKPIDASYASS